MMHILLRIWGCILDYLKFTLLRSCIFLGAWFKMVNTIQVNKNDYHRGDFSREDPHNVIQIHNNVTWD